MGGLFSITSRAIGTILTAAIYNGDRQQIVDNLYPAMFDDASTDLTAFRVTVTPGTVGSESLPTSLLGEIQRMRFVIKAIGAAIDSTVAQWYQVPANAFANGLHAARPAAVAGSFYISTNTKMLSVGTGAGVWYELPFAAGTKMVFNQASAPVGWTRDVDVDDVTLIVTAAGTGGATGGSWSMTGITAADHTHGMSSHTHTLAGGAAGYAYVHNVGFDGSGQMQSGTAGGGTGAYNYTGGPSTANTGTASATTMTSDGTWRPAYQYVLKATKD